MLFSLFALNVTGCSKPESSTVSETSQRPPQSILIGLTPERNIFEQIGRYKPLVEYLSKKTGAKIKLHVLTRYGNIVNNFISTGMDGAFFGSFTYALANRRLGVELIARPENDKGESTYHGLIFVRKDSGIVNVEQMKSKVFAFVDKATTAGYLLPLSYFKTNGIDDHKTYLEESYFAGTHEDAIYDVLNKRAHIGAAKNTEFIRLSNIDSRVRDELAVIERSPDVPQNGLAMRRDLDRELKQKIKDSLLNMHNDIAGRAVLDSFGARRFIKTTDSDYESVYNYANDIDLDLATYDYLND